MLVELVDLLLIEDVVECVLVELVDLLPVLVDSLLVEDVVGWVLVELVDLLLVEEVE